MNNEFFKIIIFLFRGMRIEITPAIWFLVPGVLRQSTIQLERIKLDGGNNHGPRKIKGIYHCQFLCFQLYGLMWFPKKTQVGKIYPPNYDWQTDPECGKKMNQLVESGYWD
jgi:hypothetical protein